MSHNPESQDNSISKINPDFSSNANIDQELDQAEDHIKAICISLQLHLTEPEEEVKRMRFFAVNHPDTDPMVLHHLAARGSCHLALRVADHPRTATHTMTQLAQHDHPDVRAALADNHNIPVELQWQLARDEHPDVRFALAEGHHIDSNVLASLLDDENPFVAHRARLTLQRKSGVRTRPTRLPGSSESSGGHMRKRAMG